MTHEALIARLEALAGPDRAVDHEIFVATFPGVRPGETIKNHTTFATVYKDGEQVASYRAGRYTASLDAALQLVPDDAAWWEVRKVQAANSPMKAFGPRGMFNAGVSMKWGESGLSGNHDNPAIALTIAALKAREASKP